MSYEEAWWVFKADLKLMQFNKTKPMRKKLMETNYLKKKNQEDNNANEAHIFQAVFLKWSSSLSDIL